MPDTDIFQDAMNSPEPENEMLEGETGLDIAESTDIYPNAEVRISRSQYSLLHLKRLYEDRGELVIDPEFQRNDVWTARQRSELIESVLMGIPLPVIYLFESRDGKKQVVDGRQRITAIIDFLNDKIRLSDLKILGNLNGKTFSQLEPKLQGIAEDFQILAYVIQPPTPERVKYDIFDRVNRGGTRLNSQEMRNALYGGYVTKLIDKICRSDAFRDATGGGVSSKRMRDRYVVLRAIAFLALFSGSLDKISRPYEYKSDIDDFLAWFMAMNNRILTEDMVDKLASHYISLFDRIYSALGSDAFRFESSRGKRRPVNMPLLETVVYLFAILPDDVVVDSPDFIAAFTDWKRTLDATGLFRRSIDSSTSVFARKAEADRFAQTLIHEK